MTRQLDILQSNVVACGQRIDKLSYSLHKNSAMFPLKIATINSLTDDQEESIDALILRYSQCVSMIQEQIFRGIAYVEQEDISDKSSRDKVLLMEKLGAIRSADDFGSAALLRNKFSHHYPEDVGQRLERLNLVVQEADFVIKAYYAIIAFLERKGFVQPNSVN